MAAYGRPALRDLFDESPTPHIAHPPRTHHRDYYVASDGSFTRSGGGLGAVIERRDGSRIARVAMPDTPPDNNVAEYRALHLALDRLAAHASPRARVGVLVDHDDLAGNVNSAVLAAQRPGGDPREAVSLPTTTRHHWRGIRARLRGFEAIRAASIHSDQNPAHPLANDPESYSHVDDPTPARGIRHDDAPTQVPPPSRADRHDGPAGD
ncbi:ribonuclease H [Halobacteriales archaeon SW_7_68_16]|nr:MAG: ribonuclease H [Halobacteriales archaeon SW_7_68_16]